VRLIWEINEPIMRAQLQSTVKPQVFQPASSRLPRRRIGQPFYGWYRNRADLLRALQRPSRLGLQLGGSLPRIDLLKLDEKPVKTGWRIPRRLEPAVKRLAYSPCGKGR